MKLNKFLAVGCAAALVSMVPSAFAASSEDIDLSNPACVIEISDSNTIRFLNVNYIRSFRIEREGKEKNVLKISTASNYGQYGQDNGVEMTYSSKEFALKALHDLRDKINDCQYDAAQRRTTRNKAK